MFTEFCCAGAQPPAFCSAPLAFSWMCFLGLYGPPYVGDRIHPGSCVPQSLKGTPSRPTVQSSRGSTGMVADDVASRLASRTFQPVGFDNAIGRPVAASTA